MQLARDEEMECEVSVLDRRETRRMYRELVEDLEENKPRYIQNVDELNEKVMVLNEMYTNVATTTECALDSKVLLQTSQILHEKVRSVNVGNVLFDAFDFVDRVLEFFGSSGTFDLESFGAHFAPVLSRPYGFAMMKGPMEIELTRRTHTQRRTVELSQKRVVAPTAIEVDDSEDTAKIVQTVWDCLALLDGPVPLFEFVYNPFSFGQTVENIFYTSFVIKDGLAAIYEHEDDILISLVQKDPTKTLQDRFQAICTITMKQWEQLAMIYPCNAPIYIPNRE